MQEISLTEGQLEIIKLPTTSHIFLEGAAGSGKTTVGIERGRALLRADMRNEGLLLLVPQRTIAVPYYDILMGEAAATGNSVTILTMGGLAQRMIRLFWPLISSEAGFGAPNKFPIFLTIETAQYYMASLIQPLLNDGLFESVTIDRNRLYSQILDNLNKAAFVGFPYSEIGERLKSAWVGEPGQEHIYDDVQMCATKFREYCLAHNLLDYSLQMELFSEYLWDLDICRFYLNHSFRHVIVENVEEDTPVAHDILINWLPEFESALIIFDWGGGYRRFLGADPKSAYRLKEYCPEKVELQDSFVSSEPIQLLNNMITTAIRTPGVPINEAENGLKLSQLDEVKDWESDKQKDDIRQALVFEYHRFYPQMLDWVANQIERLVIDDEYPPSEIVVLAPYMSDVLRFSLINRLNDRKIPVRAHRPSRSLREEPAAQCMLTLAAISFPGWGFRPSTFEFAAALIQAIEGLDLIRAQLLANIVYRRREEAINLSSFDLINPKMQERITYSVGERYEILRRWIEDNQQTGEYAPFDYFLGRLFGEVLSQPGFGFHENYQAGDVAANLIESVYKFRKVSLQNLIGEGVPLGKMYVQMFQQGVIAAQYLRSWDSEGEEAVLLAPAYTFLMRNRPVDVQFWLDIGSRGWYQRLNQPLTHPYVLSRNWILGSLWTDEFEVESSQENLYRLVKGLLSRCRQRVYLGTSDLGENGFEQRGILLKSFQRVMRNLL
jgi:hypothetical protein